MPENTHSLFQVAMEEGKALFEAHKEAEKEGAKGVPYGKRRLFPSEFKAEMEKGGEQARRNTLARLEREMGGKRQALGEYVRQMRGGK